MADFFSDGPGTPDAQVPDGPSFAFDNSYARLPERFFVRLAPTPVAAPRLAVLNHDLARELGVDPVGLAAPDSLDVLAGNRAPLGAEPLSMAYAGHQFGVWVPLLGDGRAVLLGEVIDRRAYAAIFSSKARAQLHSRVWATAEPRSDRACGSTSSASRWRRLAFRPPGRLPS